MTERKLESYFFCAFDAICEYINENGFNERNKSEKIWEITI